MFTDLRDWRAVENISWHSLSLPSSPVRTFGEPLQSLLFVPATDA
jgi:hypothetical protein